jgi:S-adenosylmethionine hydrolase
MEPGIVALLTDFGTRDAYVGVMKAVMLARFPGLRLVDLSHEIAAHDILSGAYLLYSAWDYFPAGSAFCAVVDPGVGGPRGTLMAEEGGRYLVAPDNGLVSLLDRMKRGLSVFALDTAVVVELCPPPPGRRSGSTFHGRDLFAPAAALCAAGQADRVRGPRLAPVLLPEVRPKIRPQGRGRGRLEGCIIHVDRFGNCITSLHRSDLTGPFSSGGFVVRAGTFSVQGFKATYVETEPGEALAVIGSAEFLELSVREGSAAARHGLSIGDAVWIAG